MCGKVPKRKIRNDIKSMLLVNIGGMVKVYNFFYLLKMKYVWFVYFIVISSFLIQQPINRSLVGHCDSWYYLSMFNYYYDFIVSFFDESYAYYAYYPSKLPNFIFGELSLFGALIYLPLQYILKDVIWAHFVFITCILTLNATSIYLLVFEIFKSRCSAFLSGILFVFSNYMLCSLDQQNVISIYPSLFCLYFVVKSFKANQSKFLLWGALCAGIQIYCSGYYFLFLGLVFLVCATIYYKCIVNFYSKPYLWLSGVIILVLIFPYVYLFMFSGLQDLVFTQMKEENVIGLSVHMDNIFRTHPYNWIYGDKTDKSLLYYIGSVGLGYSLLVTSIIGIFNIVDSRLRRLLLLITLLGIIVFLGPVVKIGSLSISSPFYDFLKICGLEGYMRTPVRGFMIVLVVLSIISGLYISILIKFKKWLGIFVILIFLVENVPIKLQKYDSYKYVKVPDVITEKIKKEPYLKALWILPSRVFEEKTLPVGIGDASREYIYMYWQTQFRKNMINGFGGYYPKTTFEYRNKSDSSLKEENIAIVYVKGLESQY